ncbi:hypothetical protein VUR80DRAFT_1118 [Thermomyces stellatus]
MREMQASIRRQRIIGRESEGKSKGGIYIILGKYEDVCGHMYYGEAGSVRSWQKYAPGSISMALTDSLDWAVSICFDDRIEWVFRSSRYGFDATVSRKNPLLSWSSARLLPNKHLRANSSILVPQVYSSK